MASLKEQKRERRHKKIRTRVAGTESRPRLAVFRSNKFLYAQLIDDEKGVTIAAAKTSEANKPMHERAAAAGEEIAKKALAKKIEKVVFDRGGFKYAGAIKAFADAARKGGLHF